MESRAVLAPNYWNQLMDGEYRALRRAINKGTLRFPITDLSAGNLQPGQQEPFVKMANVQTPAAGTNDATILSFDLEKGFAAIITGLAHGYQGNLYTDFSGNIVWELYVDFRFYPQYAQMIELFGDLQQPRPVMKGIAVGPGQNVSVLGTIPAASPIATGGTTYLFAAVSGVKFPLK